MNPHTEMKMDLTLIKKQQQNLENPSLTESI